MRVFPIDAVLEELKIEEGFRAFVYKCSENVSTIGYGKNIQQGSGIGITQEEATYLLENDIGRCLGECRKNFNWFNDCENDVQQILVHLCFWIGITRLLGFKKMLSALQKNNREKARAELLDSRLFQQVPNRTYRLAERLFNGNQT